MRPSRYHTLPSTQVAGPGAFVTRRDLRYVTLLRSSLFAALLLISPLSAGFESDVHFGLTQWLALRAGFDPQEAFAIATGDQRVDSGDMQYVDLAYMYACFGKDDIGARRAGALHFPSSGKLPGAPELRIVTPGGDAARTLALAATRIPPEQERYRLYQLGEALHALQDSWAHQGIPEVPQMGDPAFECDRTRAWGHPKARGGWNSHRADLTMYWPTDTVAMAKATYDVLMQYPAPPGSERSPLAWNVIRPMLTRFIMASSKAEKRDWFMAQGVPDVSFLEGISLPDGPRPLDLNWPGRKLPPLKTMQSNQHDVPSELLNFYARFFARWLTGSDFEGLASEYGAPPAKGGKRSAAPAAMSAMELAGRLRAWRLRDHGRVAEIAHALQPLSAKQRVTLIELGRKANAFAQYVSPVDGVFPLVPREPKATPLPFFVKTAPAAKGKGAKAIAVAKFRHAPYDALAVIAERIENRWRVVSIVSVVDH